MAQWYISFGKRGTRGSLLMIKRNCQSLAGTILETVKLRLSGLQVLNFVNVQNVAKDWNVEFKKIQFKDKALVNHWFYLVRMECLVEAFIWSNTDNHWGLCSKSFYDYNSGHYIGLIPCTLES